MTRIERLALYSALTALTAFAIDGILPAMPLIETDFDPASAISVSKVMTTFVLGMAIGELIIGPLSDAAGRRPAVIFGLAIFTIGTLIAAYADTFDAVLTGRFLQGLGVAGPKVGTRAMIRDRHTGPDMARILSIIFTLLILVPMIAPAIGAIIAAIGGWRGVFWAYLILAVLLGLWLWTRHPETLMPDKRTPLHPRRLATNIASILKRIDVMPLVIATGFVFGSQLVYFSVAADLFGVLYDLPTWMPALFAILATGTAAALLINVRLVKHTGMEAPILVGVLLQGLSGGGLLIAAALTDGHPPLLVLLTLGWLGFFALGLLIGNINALAMRPLANLAGLGSSIIASCSSLIAFVFASAIDLMIDGPVLSIALTFALAAPLSAICVLFAIPDSTRKQLLHSLRLSR